MGFFFASGVGSKKVNKNIPSYDLLYRLSCKACPLNKATHILSPKMEPSGSTKPLIMIIGEAPGEVEDEGGKQFVGPSGDLIRFLIPPRLKSQIRWNNVINCRPQNNRDPEIVELECCRPRVVSDIERAKPTAIFGLGGFALTWADKPGGIEMWRGRRFPIKIGTHVCWFYPMRHPSFILRSNNTLWKSDDEVAFNFDVKRAISEVEAGLPTPIVHTPEYARSDITCITGRSKGDLRYVLDFLDYAGKQDIAGVDYETSTLRPYYSDSLILTKSVSILNESIAFVCEHRESGWSSSDLELLRDAWVTFLKTGTKKISHQLAFEMEWIQNIKD